MHGKIKMPRKGIKQTSLRMTRLKRDKRNKSGRNYSAQTEVMVIRS